MPALISAPSKPTLLIPARSAAITPFSESSTTRHSPGSTPRRSAASKKISGSGFPFSQSSDVTISSIRSSISRSFRFFRTIRSREPVATASRILCRRSSARHSFTPGNPLTPFLPASTAQTEPSGPVLFRIQNLPPLHLSLCIRQQLHR